MLSLEKELDFYGSRVSAVEFNETIKKLHEVMHPQWKGEQLLYERSDDINVSRVTLDLDRGIYHENYNIEKRDRVLAERGGQVAQERYLELERWVVLKAVGPGVRARDVGRRDGRGWLRVATSRGWSGSRQATRSAPR